jgi:splicing factor 3B subunit 2
MAPISGDDSSGGGGRRLTKNEKRRLKKKSEAKATATHSATHSLTANGHDDNDGGAKDKDKHKGEEEEEELGVVVEYVPADLQSMVEMDPAMAQFKEIFEKFSSTSELTVGQSEEEEAKKAAEEEEAKKLKDAPKEETKVKTLSKKKKKLLSRLSVAELKQLVHRPDVVEAHDVTAADPRLLVYLKAYRNTVPVPRHWCHKRKYLQGKRGIEKPPFQLPGKARTHCDISHC